MSYVVRKSGGNRFHYITRSNYGRYHTDRRLRNAFIFRDATVAKSIIDLYQATDNEPKPGEFEIITLERAQQEQKIKKIDPELLKKREEREYNLSQLTDNDFAEIRQLSKVNGLFSAEIAAIYNISAHAVTRIVKGEPLIK